MALKRSSRSGTSHLAEKARLLRRTVGHLRPRFDLIDEVRRTAGVERATRRLLLGFVVPLWIGAGLADWDRHRRTDIEATAGTHESAIHALMMAEAGVPALLGLFLEINAGVLLAMLGALGMHQATAIWDVAYADGRREVTPTEQHIHGLLEIVPVMATAFLVALHWDQARTLVGWGPSRPRFALVRKRRALPRSYVAGLLSTLTALIGIPYAEEFLRCYRTDRTLAAHPQEAGQDGQA